MTFVGGMAFAVVAFAAGILLVAFRVQFSVASAKIQARYYGRVGRRTAKSSTPATVAVIGFCFLAFGVLFVVLAFLG